MRTAPVTRAIAATAACLLCACTNISGSPALTRAPMGCSCDRPTRTSTPSLARRRPPPSSTIGQADLACVHGSDHAIARRGQRQHDTRRAAIRQPARCAARRARPPCAQSARRQRRCRGRAAPVLRPLEASTHSPVSASICAASASVTASQPRLARECGRSGSRSPRELPAHCRRCGPSTWFMSVISARVGKPAPAATSTMLRASSRAVSMRRCRRRHCRHLTSITRHCSPAASFLRQDAGRDQRHRLDGGGDIADGIQPPIGRRHARDWRRRWRSRLRARRASATAFDGATW